MLTQGYRDGNFTLTKNKITKKYEEMDNCLELVRLSKGNKDYKGFCCMVYL